MEHDRGLQKHTSSQGQLQTTNRCNFVYGRNASQLQIRPALGPLGEHEIGLTLTMASGGAENQSIKSSLLLIKTTVLSTLLKIIPIK